MWSYNVRGRWDYYHVASNNKSETPRGVSDSSSTLVGYVPLPIPPRLPGVSALLAPSLGTKPDSLPEGIMYEFAWSVVHVCIIPYVWVKVNGVGRINPPFPG